MIKSKAIAFSVLANIILGSTFFIIAYTNSKSPADFYKLLSYRFIFATFFIYLIITLGEKKINYKGKPIIYPLFLALLNPIIAFSSEALALRLIPSSVFGILYSLVPIVSVGLSVVLINEKTTITRLILMMVSLCGVVVLSMGDTVGNIGLYGLLITALNIFSTSLYRVYVKKISPYYSAYELTLLINIYAGAIFTAISLYRHIKSGDIMPYFTSALDPHFIFPALYLGILASGLATFLINYALPLMPISLSGALTNICPLTAVFIGVFSLGETFGYFDLLGSSLILISGLLIGISYSKG